VRRIDHALRRRAERIAANRLPEDVSVMNGWIINFIHEQQAEGHDVYQRSVEREFGITKSAVSRSIKLMEEKGYVRQERGTEDARLRRLVLTPKAEAFSAALREDFEHLEASLVEGFSPDEITRLNDYLSRMLANLERADKRQ